MLQVVSENAQGFLGDLKWLRTRTSTSLQQSKCRLGCRALRNPCDRGLSALRHPTADLSLLGGAQEADQQSLADGLPVEKLAIRWGDHGVGAHLCQQFSEWPQAVLLSQRNVSSHRESGLGVLSHSRRGTFS